MSQDVLVLHEGRVTARGPASALDLEHELMFPPDDGHEHGDDDPRAHGSPHEPHAHARPTGSPADDDADADAEAEPQTDRWEGT